MPRKSNKSISLSQSQSQRSSQALEINTVDVQEQVNDLVRYFVNRAGEQVPFKRAEIKKNVLPKAGPNFQDIFNKAVTILKEVYGYKVIVLDPTENAAKSYIVSNDLQYISYDIANEYPADVSKVLTMLVLSHIFMSNASVGDNSLYAFLSSLGIDIDRRHEIFGQVKEFIHGTLKNKKIINIEVDQRSKKTIFSWGPRAEKEISKHDLLKFVCKMYKTSMPSSWISQYKAANEQDIENEQSINNVEQATQNT